MKKILVVVALTVSLGLLAGLTPQPAAAFFDGLGLPFFGHGAKSCSAPVCAPVCGYYYCAPAYACKAVKMKKAKAQSKAPAKAKKV
ncbi:MAG: hypothetical protein ACP5U1_11645 [Desulfomonilaceae bacterium]